MIDDYKYIYKPLYIWMYILRIVLIFGIFLCLGLVGYQNPGFRLRCLNTSLSSESVYSLAFSIGMLLWLEAMMIALSFDTLIGFLCFMVIILGLWAYLLFLPRFYLWWFYGTCPRYLGLWPFDNLNHSANVGYIPCIQHQCKAQYFHPFLDRCNVLKCLSWFYIYQIMLQVNGIFCLILSYGLLYILRFFFGWDWNESLSFTEGITSSLFQWFLIFLGRYQLNQSSSPSLSQFMACIRLFDF